MRIWFLIILGVILSSSAWGYSLEVFAKGSASKNYTSIDKHTTSVSVATGVAVTLIPRVRIEARYTNRSSLQSREEVIYESTVVGTLYDYKTETSIISLGIDIDVLGKRSAFQPFLYIGAGYVQTKNSYWFTQTGMTESKFQELPQKRGISGNLGVGFRIFLTNSFALEAEVFAYAMDIDQPPTLVNLYAQVGIRIFI